MSTVKKRRDCLVVLGIVLLVLAAMPRPGMAQVGSCVSRDWLVNVQGTNKACITVSTTAVVVLAANNQRCGALIYNNSVNGMSCTSSVDGDPTTTAGIPITGGATVSFGQEGRRAVKCIRTGGSDALACVVEWLP